MARAWLALIILSISGCGIENLLRADLPVIIYIDSRFTEDEEQVIVSAMDEWNAKAGERLKSPGPVFIYVGRYVDEDGFRPEDLVDGRHVIYRVDHPTEEYYSLQGARTTGVYGYATLGDILLFFFKFIDGPDGSDEREKHLFFVRMTVLHELGHMLGLGHFEFQEDLMNAEAINVRHISEADIEEFCILYECK